MHVVKWLALLLISSLACSGCSTRRLAVDAFSDALAQGGGTYARDDDPELVKAATPFSLKLMESLLEENPRHAGLLTTAAMSFTRYAYGFVQLEADEIESDDLAGAEAMRDRAARLYLRAKRYGLRALDEEHRGFSRQFEEDPATALGAARKKDVPALYWTAAAWAGAIALSKDQPEMVGQIPRMEAMMTRALELDEAFDRGAIPAFFITYAMSRPGPQVEREALARKFFERAVELSHGREASPFVALAEAVSVQNQNAQEFEELLGLALTIDAAAYPDTQLVNLIMQRRARWLLSREADLFLPANE